MIGASILAGIAAAGLVWISGDLLFRLQESVAAGRARRAARKAAKEAAAEAEED